MITLPTRTKIYGLTAIGHIIFTLVFPIYSVPIVIWLTHHSMYHKTIIALSIPFFATLAYFSIKRWPVIKQSRKLALFLIVTVILYIAVYETVADFGEKLHVLNFSILALLLYKTFSPIMKLEGAMVTAWFIPSLIAALDEYMQTFIPGRYGCIHDVLIAVRSATLGVIIAWIFDAYSRKGRTTRL